MAPRSGISRLCPACRKASPATADELARLGLPVDTAPPDLYQAVGCPACDFRGYRGRLAISEILAIDAELDEFIARRAHTAELRAAARRKGFHSLAEYGVRRVLDGSTSLRELARVVDLSTLAPVSAMAAERP